VLRILTLRNDEGFPMWNVTPGPPGMHLSTLEPEGTSQTDQAAMKSWGDTFRLCLIRVSNPAGLAIIAFISMRR
jgi:hypothetical protein